MSLVFSEEAESYLNVVSDEPFAVNSGNNRTTQAEKSRAKGIYEKYTNDLSQFPCYFNIGDTAYTGFGSSDFTLADKKTSNDESKHCETTLFTINHKSGLTFMLTTVFYPDYAAFDWVIYIKNNGNSNSPIVSNLTPCSINFEGNDPAIIGSYGDYLGVTAPYTSRDTYLRDGEKISFTPQKGRATDGAFPYYNFEYGNKGALIAIGWSAIWNSSFDYNNGTTTFTAKQETFNSYIEPGEIARTPLTAVVLYDGRDTDRATNLWRRWFIDCNMYRDNGKDLTEPFIAGVTSGIFSEMEKATEANQNQCIDAYVTNGIDLDVWWMDAGWYPCNDGGSNNWLKVGNWTADTSRFPTNFKSISENANSKGIKTLLWFEPERVGLSYSELDAINGTGVKKEWLVGYNESNRSNYEEDYYFQLDMSNPEAMAWLKSQIAKVLTDGGISIYREDFNIERTAKNYLTYNNTHRDRQGILENKCVQGHYEFWKYLNELDNIELIDSCASGGHRLDLESIRLSVALHPTDYVYKDMAAKQVASYNIASWIPFAGANTSSDSLRVIPYSVRSAFRQALILQYDPRNLSASEYDKLKGLVDEWKTISKYFYKDIYQLTKETYSANEWYSYSYIDSDDQSGFALVFCRDGANAKNERYIKLKGLNPQDTYKITFADSKKSYTKKGVELMNLGVWIEISENSSEVVYINRTTEAKASVDDLNKAITRAESANLSIYSQATTYDLYKAISSAKAVADNPDATKAQIKAATDALTLAQGKLKMASSSVTAAELSQELGNIISSIGTVNSENYKYKEVIIKYAEERRQFILDKYGNDVQIINSDILDAAREAYEKIANSAVDVIYGDVDNDGKVTTADALKALQYAVRKISLTDEQIKAADVNGEAGVTTADALAILQRAVGKISKFVVEG